MKVYCVFRHSKYSGEGWATIWKESTAFVYIGLSMEESDDYVRNILIPQYEEPELYKPNSYPLSPTFRVYSKNDRISTDFAIREVETGIPINIT